MTMRPLSRDARRAGVTLVEMLIALTVLGLVGAAVTTTLVKQQRMATRTSTIIDTRNQGRITLATLAAELRGLSSIGGDIDPADMTTTSLRMRAQTGTSVICWIDAGDRRRFRMPPQQTIPTTNALLTSFVDPFAPPTLNDTAWVFDFEAPSANPWRAHRLTTMVDTLPTGVRCPTGAGTYLPGVQDLNTVSLETRVDPALPVGVGVGAAVRFTRKVRYAFYQNGADGLWYLGYQNCNAGAVCGGIQPVSGPFLPASADPNVTGFRFDYFDANGLPTNVAANVARIDIIARPVSRNRISAGSATRTTFSQTDRVSVALRNRL
jgi:prepilin-type N-terminal cleavage/methylation domain-containing protein